MTTTEQGLAPQVHQTPTGWLVIGREYPRIGVTAPTEAEALQQYEEERAEWLALREAD